MVYLELDEIIGAAKAELLTHKNLGVVYYYCIAKEDFQSLPLLASDFDTKLTSIAYNGYMQRLVGKESLDKVLKLIELPQQSRFITLFHIIGLSKLY